MIGGAVLSAASLYGIYNYHAEPLGLGVFAAGDFVKSKNCCAPKQGILTTRLVNNNWYEVSRNSSYVKIWLIPLKVRVSDREFSNQLFRACGQSS